MAVEKRRTNLGLNANKATVPAALGGGIPDFGAGPGAEDAPSLALGSAGTTGDAPGVGERSNTEPDGSNSGQERSNPAVSGGSIASAQNVGNQADQAGLAGQAPRQVAPAPKRPIQRMPAVGSPARQNKLDQLMNRLSEGQERPKAVLPGPKSHQVTISLPVPVYLVLEGMAGGRQVPALVRDSMLRLAAKAEFRYAVALKDTLAASYGALVQARKAARVVGRGAGVRSITILVSQDEAKTLTSLGEGFGLSPIQLMEVLAYELVQGELAAQGN